MPNSDGYHQNGQLADGLTKIASRQQFSEALREGWMQLVHDETFTAAKKKTAKQREESRVSTTSRVAMATVAAVTDESMKGSETVEDDGMFYLCDGLLGGDGWHRWTLHPDVCREDPQQE